MLPFHFGAEGRQLFGTFHARATSMAPKCGVLLCNPFGQEALEVHRLLRLLADRLSRAGCDVLRFDYFGTGDAGGTDGDADLDAWSNDTVTAHAELMRRAKVSKVVWLGFRVGAAVAQRAAAITPSGLAKLLLMDPIADGRNYLDTLRTRDFPVEGLGHLPASSEFRSNPDFHIAEAGGFAISRVLCDQLRELRFVAGASSLQTVVICDSQLSEGREIAAACAKSAGALRVIDHAFGEDWMSRVVPPPTIKLLFDEAGSCQ